MQNGAKYENTPSQTIYRDVEIYATSQKMDVSIFIGASYNGRIVPQWNGFPPSFKR